MKKHKANTNTHIDAELDLHGYTVYEARNAVEDFLHEARDEGWRCVRIIVGKGMRSEDGVAILPDAVKSLLNQYEYHYTHASFLEGGEGALEVSL